MRNVRAIVGIVLLAELAGCGSGAATSFSNQIVGTAGQPIFLDDIEAIVNDATLSDDEKRAQIRELGIEDEELIDALLTL